eukprot:TRINITY_DN1833_c0_g1_i1.p1 TRINITY_DN1833_c0_g1~~TRINITY_DN1833_c0_g1_i1.p1  ORF type:complete len:277 (-),score=55.90 TRINITY_DN1833_c0_g1_i1:50-838(-)
MTTKFLLETRPVFTRPFTIVGAGSSLFLYSRVSIGALLIDRLAYYLGLRFHLRRGLNSEIAERRNLVLIRPRAMNFFEMREIMNRVVEPIPKKDLLILHGDIRFPLGWSSLYGREYLYDENPTFFSTELIESIQNYERDAENAFPHDHTDIYKGSVHGNEWLTWLEEKQGRMPRISFGVAQQVGNQRRMTYEDYNEDPKAVKPSETYLRNKFPVHDTIRLKTHLADQLLILALKTRFGPQSQEFKELSSYIPVHNPIPVIGY